MMVKLTTLTQDSFLPPVRLSLSAARFMREEMLAMRNSNTRQVSSLHYQGHQCYDSHGVGGIYSVPLWTIAICDITKKDQTREIIAERINKYKQAQRRRVPKIPHSEGHHTLEEVFFDTLDPELAFASHVEQQQHLDHFLNAIKTFINPFTAFGVNANEAYDYELLIAGLNNEPTSINFLPWIDDFGRYSTGGRCVSSPFNSENIVYRVTFNQVEVNFFKSILAHAYDSKIFSDVLSLTSDEIVAASVRHFVCNNLATEIITTKLVHFLNARGQLTQVPCLNKLNLEQLLNTVLESNDAEILDIVKHGHIHRGLGRFDYTKDKTYPVDLHAEASSPAGKRMLNRYILPIYQKFYDNHPSIDTVRNIYFHLTHLIHAQLKMDSLHEDANKLLQNIDTLCKNDSFDQTLMAIILIRYRLICIKVRNTLTDLETAIDEPTSDQRPSPHQNEYSMHILNGFLVALGVSAVAIALTVLSSPEIGTLGICIASVGALSITAGGFAFFNQHRTSTPPTNRLLSLSPS